MIRVSIAILAALALAIFAWFHSHTAQADTCSRPRLEELVDRHDTIFVGEAVSVRPEWTAHRPLADLSQGILPYYLHGRHWVFDKAYIVEFKVSSILKGETQETAYYKLIDTDTHKIDAEEGITHLYGYFGGHRVIELFVEGTEYVVFSINGWVHPQHPCHTFTPRSYASRYKDHAAYMRAYGVSGTIIALEDSTAAPPGSVARMPVVPLPHKASATKWMIGDASSYFTPSVDFHGDTYGESAVVKRCCTDEELKRLWQGVPISTAASARYYEEAGELLEYWQWTH